MRVPTLVVLAKAPVPGLAKTRLAREVGPRQAADLAAASLLDTLEAVAAAADGSHRPVVALTGALGDAARAGAVVRALAEFTVVGQRGDGLDARIAAAHLAAARHRPGHGTLQVGMDTPQVSASDLHDAARRLTAGATDAVLGPADDGGWWALGLADPAHVRAVLGVPTSRDDTGARTARALCGAGLRTAWLDSRRDVDTWADALAVADTHPGGRFAAAVRRVAAEAVA